MQFLNRLKGGSCFKDFSLTNQNKIVVQMLTSEIDQMRVGLEKLQPPSFCKQQVVLSFNVELQLNPYYPHK
jgi:hypothetical protein